MRHGSTISGRTAFMARAMVGAAAHKVNEKRAWGRGLTGKNGCEHGTCTEIPDEAGCCETGLGTSIEGRADEICAARDGCCMPCRRCRHALVTSPRRGRHRAVAFPPRPRFKADLRPV